MAAVWVVHLAWPLRENVWGFVSTAAQVLLVLQATTRLLTSSDKPLSQEYAIANSSSVGDRFDILVHLHANSFCRHVAALPRFFRLLESGHAQASA